MIRRVRSTTKELGGQQADENRQALGWERVYATNSRRKGGSPALEPANAPKRPQSDLTASPRRSHLGAGPAPAPGHRGLHPHPRPVARRNRKWGCKPGNPEGRRFELGPHSELPPIKPVPLLRAVASREEWWDLVEYGEYPFPSESCCWGLGKRGAGARAVGGAWQ